MSSVSTPEPHDGRATDTGAGPRSAADRQGISVQLLVEDERLHDDLAAVVRDHGWARPPGGASRTVVVADLLVTARAARPPVDILVTTASPADARLVVKAFARGTVGAVIDGNDPASLARMVEVRLRGLAAVPTHVVDAATRLDGIDDDTYFLLVMVALGMTQGEMARTTGTSVTAVRRRLARARRHLGTAPRTGLRHAARAVGFLAAARQLGLETSQPAT